MTRNLMPILIIITSCRDRAARIDYPHHLRQLHDLLTIKLTTQQHLYHQYCIILQDWRTGRPFDQSAIRPNGHIADDHPPSLPPAGFLPSPLAFHKEHK
ncbi:hypothetical protein [Sphingobium sp. AP50]|uniref:hypothetical protein n=1 Tax=Sphingobium sp. AP50 TaxID=1884369 RepID=UPI0011604DAB|nr:hypothetical protein [Sphingobium sp. AP50]